MQLILLSLLLLWLPDGCQSWSLSAQHRYWSVQPLQAKRTLTVVWDTPHTNHDTWPQNDNDDETNERQQPLPVLLPPRKAAATRRQQQEEASFSLDRRRALWQTATIAAGLFAASSATAATTTTLDEEDDCGLEDILLGKGTWTHHGADDNDTSHTPLQLLPPATFVTYMTRFLLRYDDGASSWWKSLEKSNSLLSQEQQQTNLGRSFGSLAKSVQIAIQQYLQQQEPSSSTTTTTTTPTTSSVQKGYEQLAQLFVDRYGRTDPEARRHIGLLFAMLPTEYQPVSVLQQVSFKKRRRVVVSSASSSEQQEEEEEEREVSVEDLWPIAVDNPPPRILRTDLIALLPPEYECVKQESAKNGGGGYTIYPPLSLYEVGIDEEFGQTATATAAGPLAGLPLRRERPRFGWDVYTLFGVSGATGCALTHTVVIPLDVVKTRIQTDSTGGGSLLDSAKTILEKEGLSGLLLGTQATIVGYLWYGLSVYPSYTFFKRFLAMSVLSPDVAAVHANDVALVAGALAAVIASLGLTPMEACRIRTVAQPEQYRSMGLLGTLRAIAQEDPGSGWRTLYAGLPSLLTRQVIFGSVKFLAFERACEAIFHVWPILHDATWTSLTVSLVAGGFSGCLSSVVSQPADSVLTYVAQNNNNNGGGGGGGLIEGCQQMVQQDGFGSLFRGLGSRCVWAGSIIAGQFLLYDVFRSFFGVSGDDLSQIYQVAISTAGQGL